MALATPVLLPVMVSNTTTVPVLMLEILVVAMVMPATPSPAEPSNVVSAP